MFCRSSKFASAEDYGNGRGQGGVALFWDKRLEVSLLCLI